MPAVTFEGHMSGNRLIRLHKRQVGYLLNGGYVSLISRQEDDVCDIVRAAVERECGTCKGINMPPELPEEMFE